MPVTWTIGLRANTRITPPALEERSRRADRERTLSARARVHWPDHVARRFWAERHGDVQHLREPVEPDGARLEAAVDLSNALYRWQNPSVYGLSAHPLDDPDPRFAEFLEDPALTTFQPWSDRRVDVSNERNAKLFDDGNIRTYYSTWQLLLAAEVADAGIHYRIDLANKDAAGAALDAMRAGKAPSGPAHFRLQPVHATRELLEHERALDTVVWFAEESSRALLLILRDQLGGRFRLTESQAEHCSRDEVQAASAACLRYAVTADDLLALDRCLAEHCARWSADGCVRVTDSYKEVLAKAANITMLTEANVCLMKSGQTGGNRSTIAFAGHCKARPRLPTHTRSPTIISMLS